MPSPPVTYNQKREKKIEFSPRLDPIDSSHAYDESPVHNGSTWDSETDHMLSYFLGGEGAHGHSTLPDFASSVTEAVGESVARHSRNDEGNEPPPTPAVQHFYTGRSMVKPRDYRATISTNSESLPSMAAALITGGPMVQRHFQQLKQSSSKETLDSFENPSPISPAALIGTPQENLLLPPIGSTDGEASPLNPFQRQLHHHNHSQQQQQQQQLLPLQAQQLQQQQQQQQKQLSSSKGQQDYEVLPQQNTNTAALRHQQHVAWLSEMNARAKLAAGQHSGFIPPLHPMPQQPPVAIPASATSVPMQHMMGYFPHPHLLPQHANPFLFAAAQAMAQHQPQDTRNPVESEEKRVKRLERNRESARKSRRRKKEKLETLEAQVNKLHQEIETERRSQINAMVTTLKPWRVEEMQKLHQKCMKGYNEEETRMCLDAVIQYSGPFSTASKCVLEYQYNRLRQVTLPGYQKFLLWCVILDDSFFAKAKEEFSRRAESSGNSSQRASANKVSSKQIGEDFFMAGTKVGITDSESGASDRQLAASSFAYDGSKTWPLFCFEMKFSVDQEEKFLAYRKKAREIPHLRNIQLQMTAAVQTVESLRCAVESVGRAVSSREQQTLTSILNPLQTVAYQDWLGRNRDKCESAISPSNVAVIERPRPASNSGAGFKDTSLQDICRRLNEVLRISKAP